MKNLIPLFIAKKLAERKQNGEFHGFSIFFDISGFTAMTVKLMKEGKAGAEIISNILDDIFSPIVDLIHSNNGFVASFIGDAINAIFIDDKKENLDKGIFSKSVDTGNYLPISVIKSLSGIINIVKNKRIQKTKYGDFKLSIKIGVSYGKIKWGIAGTENHKAYYFMGEAIDKSIQNEKKCKKMQIVTDDTTLQYFSNIVQIHNIKDKNFIDKKFYIIDKLIDDKLKVQNKNSEPTDIFLTYNLLKIFFPDEIIKFNYKGEYREIVSIFISIKKEDNFEQIDKIIKIIISKCDDFQGYFNKVDFTDKGFTIIIFFGFPITYEDNLKRSLNFILSIKKILKQNIKAGITLGIAFSGILGNSTRCEYTCLGNIVNLSARMMTKAKYGKIWITKIIANKIKNDFIIEDKGYRKFKGIKEKINIFELKDEKRTVEISDSRFLIPMVGREIEFDKIIKYIQDIGNNKNSKLLYIYGDAGIGKSRLIYEAIKSHENIFNFFNLQTDSIIKGSLYPFADFLKKYFMQDTAKSEKQNKENFEKIYDKLLNKLSSIINKDAEGLIKELNRTKSFIAALIGIYYEKSPYQTIDPKGRYENTLYALKDFFIANSLLKPTIIILEDLQWLDYDSMEEFKILTRNIKNYKIGLILTGRFFDDGSKPLLKIDDDIEKDEIYLENLSTLSSEKLIDIQLTDRADEKLKSFIFSKTLGNPFYIEQFCQYLIENNLIIRTEQGYKLIDKNIDIPSSINLIIMARIDRLSQELKEAVQVASVIGVEFELQILYRLINEVMKHSIEDNNEIVYECEKQKIWISLSEIKYIFKHALLQQVAYEMQLKQRLIFVHNLTGKIMEELFKDNPQKYIEIAYHYDKAENIEKAIFYFHKAAEFCKANYNNNETIKCYDKLLTLVKNEEKIIEILNNKGLVLELMGDWDNSEKCYREAMQISLKLNNQYLICKSKELVASLLISKGSYDSAMDLLIEAEAIAKEIGDERQYSFILKDFGNIYSNQGEYDKALEYFERMKDVCLKIDDKIGYSIALENIGNVFSDKGHYEKAMKYYDEKKNICLQINDKRGYSVAIGNLGLCYHYKGELDKALECYEERKKICFEIGDRTGYAIAVGNIGNIYKDKFDLENALKCFEEIKEIFLSMGDKRRYSIAIGNIGSLFLSKGDFENAINNFELQKEICLLLDNKRGYITAISMLGQSFYFMEDYDNALKYLDEAIELAKSLNLDYHLSDLLRKKAELLYEINEIEKAKTINENSYEISKIIEAKDQIFEYNVLKYKIEKDKDRLLSLLEKTDEDEEIALIYYTLFKIIDDELDKMKYKKMAIQLYENLFHKTGFYYYKKQLKDLKN